MTAAEVEVRQLSATQRPTIRGEICTAIADHGAEWAARHACADPERKYGLPHAAIQYLVDGELPAAPPEESLTAGQEYHLRHECRTAHSLPNTTQRNQAVAAVFKKYEDLYGLSEDAVRAVVGAECDDVRPSGRPEDRQCP